MESEFYEDKIQKLIQKIFKNQKEDELSALGLSQRTKLTPKPKLRGDDYNPLTGQSSNPDGGASCSYRPGRKGEKIDFILNPIK